MTTRPLGYKPCPVLGCNGWRKKSQVMCPRCWAQVPSAIARRVWHLYRTAQGSPEHLAAMREAIESVPGPTAAETLRVPVAGETRFNN
jgi:hypothetical protein